jgi:hypothetical protein
MTEYHVVMTLACSGTTLSFTGTVTPRPGSTRLSLFKDLVAETARQADRDPEHCSTLFFSLEPNKLPAAGIERV